MPRKKQTTITSMFQKSQVEQALGASRPGRPPLYFSILIVVLFTPLKCHTARRACACTFLYVVQVIIPCAGFDSTTACAFAAARDLGEYSHSLTFIGDGPEDRPGEIDNACTDQTGRSSSDDILGNNSKLKLSLIVVQY